MPRRGVTVLTLAALLPEQSAMLVLLPAQQSLSITCCHCRLRSGLETSSHLPAKQPGTAQHSPSSARFCLLIDSASGAAAQHPFAVQSVEGALSRPMQACVPCYDALRLIAERSLRRTARTPPARCARHTVCSTAPVRVAHADDRCCDRRTRHQMSTAARPPSGRGVIRLAKLTAGAGLVAQPVAQSLGTALNRRRPGPCKRVLDLQCGPCICPSWDWSSALQSFAPPPLESAASGPQPRRRAWQSPQYLMAARPSLSLPALQRRAAPTLRPQLQLGPVLHLHHRSALPAALRNQSARHAASQPPCCRVTRSAPSCELRRHPCTPTLQAPHGAAASRHSLVLSCKLRGSQWVHVVSLQSDISRHKFDIGSGSSQPGAGCQPAARYWHVALRGLRQPSNVVQHCTSEWRLPNSVQWHSAGSCCNCHKYIALCHQVVTTRRRR